MNESNLSTNIAHLTKVSYLISNSIYSKSLCIQMSSTKLISKVINLRLIAQIFIYF